MYKKAEVTMVQCPYNRAHTVSKLRVQKHITKCKENYPDVKLVSCFYNYSHRFKPEDMLSHYEVCSNKTRLDSSNYEPSSYSGSSQKNDNTEEFPNINIKPKFFTTKTFDSVDELEPLPLPKTTSKAFVIPKSKPSEINSEGISSGFGRAKNLLSDVRRPLGLTKNLENHKQDEKKSFGIPPLGSSSASITSSMFDDNITLQSESIIFEESISEVNSDSEFVFKNFNRCLKI